MIEFDLAKKALDEIAVRISQNKDRLGRARAEIDAASADLAQMSAVYGPIVTEIATTAAASAGNPAWINAAAESELLVAVFVATEQRAQAMQTAIGGL